MLSGGDITGVRRRIRSTIALKEDSENGWGWTALGNWSKLWIYEGILRRNGVSSEKKVREKWASGKEGS